jgi:inosine-uridine nucleoside N-ribohydrolase
MRQILVTQPNRSVRIVATGFSTNLAGLLDSPANYQNDRIPLKGIDLIRQKVEFLVMMAGNFKNHEHGEHNVAQNVPAFRKVITSWQSPIILSGFEIGEQVFSRWEHLKVSLKTENPIRMAYETFFREVVKEERWDRPSWDQTAMLWAIEPDHHFASSDPVEILVNDQGGITTQPRTDQTKPECRYLSFTTTEPAEKIEQLLAGWYREKE